LYYNREISLIFASIFVLVLVVVLVLDLALV